MFTEVGLHTRVSDLRKLRITDQDTGRAPSRDRHLAVVPPIGARAVNPCPVSSRDLLSRSSDFSFFAVDPHNDAVSVATPPRPCIASDVLKLSPFIRVDVRFDTRDRHAARFVENCFWAVASHCTQVEHGVSYS